MLYLLSAAVNTYFVSSVSQQVMTEVKLLFYVTYVPATGWVCQYSSRLRFTQSRQPLTTWPRVPLEVRKHLDYSSRNVAGAPLYSM